MPSTFPSTPDDRFFRRAMIVEVIDGDTIDVEIDLGWSMRMKERLRLESVNTPETRGDAEREAGRWVKARVAEYLPADTRLLIASTVYDRTGRARGKFGRTVAIVYPAIEGWCLNERLLEDKLAWPTDDNGSLVGERSLALLTGLPEELGGVNDTPRPAIIVSTFPTDKRPSVANVGRRAGARALPIPWWRTCPVPI